MRKNNLKNALIIPDCHVPFHDQKAFDLMLDCASSINIDEVVILGDFIDFYSISSHSKSPSIVVTIQEEVLVAHKLLARLKKKFPKADLIYLVGNHSFRLNRFIENYCPQLFGMIGLEGILRPDVFKMKLIHYGRNQKHLVLGSKLIARHEPISGGEHCAAGTVKKAVASVIFGHTHRVQEYQIKGIHGDLYRGISCGWLGDSSHEVFDYLKNHDQWSQAFAIVSVLPNRNFFCQLIHIIDGKCIFDGRIYE